MGSVSGSLLARGSFDNFGFSAQGGNIALFSRAGIVLPSTRAYVLRGVDHPAVPLLLEFKELYRIWTAHGWGWLREWVYDLDGRAAYVEKLGSDRIAGLKPGSAPSGSVEYGEYR